MKNAVLLLISEGLLILAVILVCAGLKGIVGFNMGWPISQFVLTVNAETRGIPVAFAVLFLIGAAVTLVASVIGLVKQPKAG